MKVARKHIYAQEDCFSAWEGTTRVHISRRRHTVTWEATDDNGQTICGECSLADLSRALVANRKTLGEL